MMNNEHLCNKFYTAVFVVLLCVTFAYAGPFSDVPGMGQDVKNYYNLIRNISYPCAALSIVYGALLILGVGNFSNKSHEDAMEAGKKQIVITIIVLAIILLIPVLFEAAYNLAQRLAWNPSAYVPSTSPLLTPQP